VSKKEKARHVQALIWLGRLFIEFLKLLKLGFKAAPEQGAAGLKTILWVVPRGVLKGLKKFLKAILYNSPVLMIFPTVFALVPLICGQYIDEPGATVASSSKMWSSKGENEHSGIIPYGKLRASTVPLSN
jgi:hypothetical protein